MIRIELVLSVLAVILAWLIPNPLVKAFEFVKSRTDILATWRTSCVILVGVLAIAARLAVLPIEPIPVPTVGDEFSYLLMSDTFAHGRIANPTHPMWIHFETFHVNQRPTYVSKYFPAQGVFLAFGQAVLGQAFWGVVLSSALMCGAICWMLQGWTEPAWALIGGILAVIRLATFSYWNNSYFGGAVTALGGALVLGSVPRLRENARIRYALTMGMGFCLLFGSRPFESIFFAIPIFATVGLWLFRSRLSINHDSVTRACLALFCILVVLASCLALYCWKTTGNPIRPPYLVNRAEYQLTPLFPWGKLSPAPEYRHATIEAVYAHWEVDQYWTARNHPVEVAVLRAFMLWTFFLGPVLTLPLLALLAAFPFDCNQVAKRDRTILLVVAITTLLAVGVYIGFTVHYAAAITCVIYFLVVESMNSLSYWKPSGRKIGSALIVGALAVCIVLTPIRAASKLLGIDPQSQLNYWAAPVDQLMSRSDAISRIKSQEGKHLALVRYGSHHFSPAEWVHNDADIDGSSIVWAHDMGPEKNQELLDYYKDRKIWLVEPDENPVRIRPYPVPDAHTNRPSPHP
jgi:hypothetical protein